MVRIKICGLRRAQDAEAAIAAGADALGFNFWPEGPRYISPAVAAAIIRNVPPGILTVGVFVDEDPQRVLEIAHTTGIAALQLHGNESPEYLGRLNGYVKIKALKVSPEFQPEQLRSFPDAQMFLLDGFVAGLHGGTGSSFDWAVAEKAAAYGKILVAGGLRPGNVAEAVRRARPWGVDVASGVESEPGKKDPRLIREFVAAVRDADREASNTCSRGEN